MARFSGSGTQTITAMAADSEGNLIVAGNTDSPDFPVRNGAQTALGGEAIFRSDDRGQTWRVVSPPPVQPLAFAAHPTNPRILVIGSRRGIHISTDGGTNWRHVYAWTSARPVSPLRVCFDPARPNQVYALAADSPSELATSSDAGEHWQVRPAPPSGGSNTLQVDAWGMGHLYWGRYRSQDQGRTWARILPATNSGNADILPHPARPGRLYGIVYSGANSVLHRSDDSGRTWSTLSSPADREVIQRLLLHPDDPGTVVAVSSNVYAISTDMGRSWARRSAPGVLTAIQGRQCGGGALVLINGSGGAIRTSLDDGATWTPPQLTDMQHVAEAPDCVLYAVRTWQQDGFVAKLARDTWEPIWITFLGGAGAESVLAIAVDGADHVYAAGATQHSGTSPDAGQRDLFTARFDPYGRLSYLTRVPREPFTTVSSMAVDAAGQAHVAAIHGLDGDAILFRYNAWGDPLASVLLPKLAGITQFALNFTLPRRVAVAALPNGEMVAGGAQLHLIKVSPDGEIQPASPGLPGIVRAMRTARDGSVYIAGRFSGGARSGRCLLGFFFGIVEYLPAEDIYIAKYDPATGNWTQESSASGECFASPESLDISEDGALTVGFYTQGQFPLANAIFPIAATSGETAVARFHPEIEFGTFLSARSAIVAGSPNGGIFAALPGRAEVIRIEPRRKTQPLIRSVHHAFSGTRGDAVAGSLLTILGDGLAPEFLDLGLNSAAPLPTMLGGTRILFNGEAAQILQVAPHRVICVPPPSIGRGGFVAIEVIANGAASPTVYLPVVSWNQGLLTRTFPDLPPTRSGVDAYARNADGSLNSAENPAAPGSTLTLFATGAGPNPVIYWNAPAPARNQLLFPYPSTARPVPGFVPALTAIDIRIPTGAGPGVYLVPIPGRLTRISIGRVDDGPWIYVK